MNPENFTSGLTFHHTAIVVESIEDSLLYYAPLFGSENISKPVMVDSQKVKVCLIKIAASQYIELVEPIGEESKVYNLLKKRISYYHLAYTVKDIYAMVKRLEELNFKAIEFFESSAFGGKTCVFLYTPDAHLIELIEE